MSQSLTPSIIAPDTAALLLAARHPDPFSVLGPHTQNRSRWVTAIDPGADKLSAIVAGKSHPLTRIDGPLFSGKVPGTKPYHLRGENEDTTWDYDDAYRFGPVLTDMDEHLLGEGTHQQLWKALGAHVITHEGTPGTHFAVWAPAASRVSVVGDFNAWDGRRHMMRRRGGTGVWETFVPGASDGQTYKYEIADAHGHIGPLKADPVGFGSQHPPAKASVIRDISGYGWSDKTWMDTRTAKQSRDAPISIYEVQLGSWKRHYDDGGRPYSYRELATDLIDYVTDMGFTHIELMPVSEFPFDGSWGYQPVGLYAPTIRFGPPHEFRDLIDAAHTAGLGVLLDWVPGHFPTDEHGLGRFDGTHLYEHADPKEGFHQDWNTLIYNYGRVEVANYLTANALYWLDEYHIDGLRVDAVASMLYRDYSRNDGEWIPNKDGGRENYEAINLFHQVNTQTYGQHPGIMTVAEESTSFPGVSQPVDAGGLGFGYKWNMGWMNDTLDYMEKDPVHRKHHHDAMTRPLLWQYSENFVLPISHDEVVHGKGSMLSKMPGNEWEKFANLRAYYGYMWGFPGKKLLFMGCEFAQPEEWDHDAQLDWDAAKLPLHKGMQSLIRDLNTLYTSTPALYAKDCEPGGFQWIDGGNADQSVLSWIRTGNDGDASCVVICNFTPIERSGFAIGVPSLGFWSEQINTDAHAYGGGDRGNLGGVDATADPLHGQPASLRLTLPPLSTLVLKLAK